jgi:NADPH:quinone reductase-like Zn-dependent oxidoreductase
MQIIRIHPFGSPDVMRLEAATDPQPSAGQLVIDVRAIGVNPVDTYIRAGSYGARQFPFTPASDAAGVIESVAPPSSRSFTPGWALVLPMVHWPRWCEPLFRWRMRQKRMLR